MKVFRVFFVDLAAANAVNGRRKPPISAGQQTDG